MELIKSLKILLPRDEEPIYIELSNSKKIYIPIPQMNLLDGGAHVGAADDIQEYMILPHGFKKYSDALMAGAQIFQLVKVVRALVL